MVITALVENQTYSELKSMHGLSLYIETKNHKILFDLGPDKTLFENAAKRNIDLSEIDTVIISHGHMDHGGALKQFLEKNSKAKIYVQREAFEPHYTKVLFFKIGVGMDAGLKTHPQIVLVDGDYQIDQELSLFTVKDGEKCHSRANDMLYEKDQKDRFLHEQNLVIREEKTALIMGCGHKGVVNIMEKAKKYHPQVCVGGYHLYNPALRTTVPKEVLNEIAEELKKYRETEFYTCHCTGKAAFAYLSNKMPNMHYLSCGECITF
ncbi:MAG: MBL fold metallo-hydrolase [Lachnospiraceae bacterium]|nr:MBL fold metallo-hydrolase [Lachnospiraceae bacterium]